MVVGVDECGQCRGWEAEIRREEGRLDSVRWAEKRERHRGCGWSGGGRTWALEGVVGCVGGGEWRERRCEEVMGRERWCVLCEVEMFCSHVVGSKPYVSRPCGLMDKAPPS